MEGLSNYYRRDTNWSAEYWAGYRAGKRAYKRDDLQLLRDVELEFANGTAAAWEHGFMDAWEALEEREAA